MMEQCYVVILEQCGSHHKESRAVRRIFLPGGHTGSGALITIFRFVIA